MRPMRVTSRSGVSAPYLQSSLVGVTCGVAASFFLAFGARSRAARLSTPWTSPG